jgi:hypothetical protein
VRIALYWRVFGKGFQNGAHIADRHFLVEQVLQHLVQRG